jgi:hypothetical protein
MFYMQDETTEGGGCQKMVEELLLIPYIPLSLMYTTDL